MKFTRQLLRLLQPYSPIAAALKYHGPDERNPSGSGWAIERSLIVTYRRRRYGIRFCQVQATDPEQVFVARLQDGEGDSNNFHLSFSSAHADSYGIFFASPSLKRCKGRRLVHEPVAIGNYPAKVAGLNRQILGKLDADFFPRVFSVVDAKFDRLI
jgi:hypothetical protein